MEQAKVRSLPQRLDSFNKILLATATINYMASALDGVLKDYQTILSSIKSGDDDFSHNVIKDGLISKNNMMSETLKRLCDTIEELGNYPDHVVVYSEVLYKPLYQYGKQCHGCQDSFLILQWYRKAF